MNIPFYEPEEFPALPDGFSPTLPGLVSLIATRLASCPTLKPTAEQKEFQDILKNSDALKKVILDGVAWFRLEYRKRHISEEIEKVVEEPAGVVFASSSKTPSATPHSSRRGSIFTSGFAGFAPGLAPSNSLITERRNRSVFAPEFASTAPTSVNNNINNSGSGSIMLPVISIPPMPPTRGMDGGGADLNESSSMIFKSPRSTRSTPFASPKGSTTAPITDFQLTVETSLSALTERGTRTTAASPRTTEGSSSQTPRPPKKKPPQYQPNVPFHIAPPHHRAHIRTSNEIRSVRIGNYAPHRQCESNKLHDDLLPREQEKNEAQQQMMVAMSTSMRSGYSVIGGAFTPRTGVPRRGSKGQPSLSSVELSRIETHQDRFFARLSEQYHKFLVTTMLNTSPMLQTHKDRFFQLVPVFLGECIAQVLYRVKDSLEITSDSQKQVNSFVATTVTFWCTGIEVKLGSLVYPHVPRAKKKLQNAVKTLNILSAFQHPVKTSCHREIRSEVDQLSKELKMVCQHHSRETLRATARRQASKIGHKSHSGMKMRQELMERRMAAGQPRWYEKQTNDHHLDVTKEVKGRFVLNNWTPALQSHMEEIGCSNNTNPETILWSL
eukprot:PhM_4_TR19111/c0_g2_i1/m.63528